LRVFNPALQTEKFDPKLEYIKKWVPEYAGSSYPKPIVEHKIARQKAIDTYKNALSSK
jgi:deoxyribodipyrimidine photo-lyase